MKKLVTIAIAAVVAVGLLAGCTAGGSSSSASTSSSESFAAVSDGALSSGSAASSSASAASSAASASAASASAAAASATATASAAATQASSAESTSGEDQAQDQPKPQRAPSTYQDTRERTVDPVQQPEGSLVEDYGKAIADDGASAVDALEEDMTAGVIPIYASVYVDDPKDPFVICTSADDVVNLYNAITKVDVGSAASPSDSTYYAVEFGMQNGDVVDFVFTGRDTIDINGETRSISNADELWAQIQAFLDEAEE